MRAKLRRQRQFSMNHKLLINNLLLLKCISLASYFHLYTYIFLFMANKNEIFDLKVKKKNIASVKKCDSKVQFKNR